ncbi:MAG: type II toxin-antitoxin system HicB family antitoxin [Spirochaetaceae bacterium]|jgi:predicted RNase H-like HicB family nuclease|nr:type II toxin-antitoxin system HicB family antitoxin [Spirochaetaceae bacterium]
MEYVYPAIFYKNEDESYTIVYPDLPGCISEGKSLGNAMYMAQSALTQWMGYLKDKKQKIPPASSIQDVKTSDGGFVNLVRAEVKVMRTVKRAADTPNAWAARQRSPA